MLKLDLRANLFELCTAGDTWMHTQKKYFLHVVVLTACLAFNGMVVAQNKVGPNDTILVSAIVVGTDTVPFRWLDPIWVVGLPSESMKRYKANQKLKQGGSTEEYYAYLRLRNRVTKVFPYAAAAGDVVADLDSVLPTYYSKDARQAYKQRREAQLYARFKAELVDMDIAEGEILIKLVSRQTGKDVYTVVNELKGKGFAFASQGIARLFGHNLRDYYEPNGADVAIEAIVKELERTGYKQLNY
jgi:hypothetical protein